MSAGQAREEMRRYLEKIGYTPEPGLVSVEDMDALKAEM